MKYVKTLGLATVVVAASVSVLGVGAASATVLCKESPGGATTGTTCPAGQAYGGGTEFRATLDPGTGPSKTTTSFKSIECNKSTIAGSTENEGSATTTVLVQLETVTFEECNCTVAVLEKGSLEIHWISGSHNGAVTSTGLEETVNCNTIFGTMHCIYSTNATSIGTLTGGNPSTLDVTATSIPITTTDPLCPEKRDWDAKYEITAPKPLFVGGHT
jgi:hypothetical protein